jgi:hypothetical protein
VSRLCYELCNLGRADHVLAGQARDVRAGAADESPLDHDHGAALLRELPGDVLPGFAATKNEIGHQLSVHFRTSHTFGNTESTMVMES